MEDWNKLRNEFEYEPDTGLLKRVVFTHGNQKQYPQGLSSEGYLQMRWCGRVEKLHRLVWFWHKREVPAWLDHINGDRKDNRIENLRECSATENSHNRKMREDNVVGLKGVSFKRGLFVSRIQIDGKRVFLGSFDSPEKAHQAYCDAAEINFKEFSKTE